MVAVRPQLQALYHYYCEYDAFGLIVSFAVPDQQPEPDLIKNFLGVKIPVTVYPPILEPLKGKVEPVPDPGNWHADIAEWGAALLSVVRAKDGCYRIVELGCGWGCWLVNMGAAARARGLDVELIGVEGDANHLVNAREVLELNGFAESQFRLNHGIAAPKLGKAIFPKPEQGTAAWGGEAIFYPDRKKLAAARTDPSVQVLDCLTLEALSEDKIIDLLHIDIQGAETDYVRGNMDSMNRLVRRVLIGTHSRSIEGQLTDHFLNAGWRMEMDRPVIAPLRQGKPVTGIDGVQLWANPELI
jgi:hypothetical protein